MKNNLLAILDGSAYGSQLYPLSKNRATSSIPFFGKYRLVDFALSSLTNSGCKSVAVYVNHGARSLHDHVGSGNAWGLNNNRDGLFILDTENEPIERVIPYSLMRRNIRFLKSCRQEYVLIGHCSVIHDIDFSKLLDVHINSGNDISILTKHEKEVGFYILAVDLLINLIETNEKYYEVDIIHTINNRPSLSTENIEITTYFEVFDSVQKYFNESLNLISQDQVNPIFESIVRGNGIKTKKNYSVPTTFNHSAKIINSAVANGCLLNCEKIENSIIFRSVKIDTGSLITDSIIMATSSIGRDCTLENVIIDRYVDVPDGSVIIGTRENPKYISKSEDIK